jgi:lysozyme family protein
VSAYLPPKLDPDADIENWRGISPRFWSGLHAIFRVGSGRRHFPYFALVRLIYAMKMTVSEGTLAPMKFEDALRHVLRWEGDYSNHPQDRGGATKFGITARTLSEWLGRPVTTEDVRDLEFDDVVPIYRERYWDACSCSGIPHGIDLLIFDSAVNQGPNRAKRLLQRALGVTEDGIIGPITMRAIQTMDPQRLASELVAQRAAHYASLQSTFHLGWFRRLADMHRESLAA